MKNICKNSTDEYKPFFNLMDSVVQDYLKDACRIYPVKIYACEFYKEVMDERPKTTIYFTSRFELGHSSVYTKLNSINGILCASNES